MNMKIKNEIKKYPVLEEDGETLWRDFTPYEIRQMYKHRLLDKVSSNPFVCKIKSGVDKNEILLLIFKDKSNIDQKTFTFEETRRDYP